MSVQTLNESFFIFKAELFFFPLIKSYYSIVHFDYYNQSSQNRFAMKFPFTQLYMFEL